MEERVKALSVTYMYMLLWGSCMAQCLTHNPRGPGIELHWILWVVCGSVLGQDTSEPKPSTGETQQRHE